MPLIFDFDCTITKEHTFKKHCIEQARDINQYELGKEIGPDIIAKGIEEKLLHNEQQFSAIATHHNNPEFIAGIVSLILGQKLTLKKQQVSTTSAQVALNIYQVENSNKPFLISYIPYKEYSKTLSTLIGKNEQITLIRNTWIKAQLIDKNTKINFYDDDSNNVALACDLSYLNVRQVKVKYGIFTIAAMYASSKIEPTGDELTSEDSIKTTPEIEHSDDESEQNSSNKTANALSNPDSQLFQDYLSKIGKKANHLLQNGHTKAARAAEQLHESLTEHLVDLNSDKLSLEQFKRICHESIVEAHKELDKHRGWSELLGNVSAFILGLVIGGLVKGVLNTINKKSFFFVSNTNSAELLDETDKCIQSLCSSESPIL